MLKAKTPGTKKITVSVPTSLHAKLTAKAGKQKLTLTAKVIKSLETSVK